jgi:methionine--tRNA ligase beta chain
MTTEKYPITDFSKLDLRVGLIKKAEKHPNADKLLVLTVDIGSEDSESPRTIVAGLAQFYKPSDLENKKAIFITNLAPVSLRGIESNGMILAASNEDKSKVSILTPDDQNLEIGSKVY